MKNDNKSNSRPKELKEIILPGYCKFRRIVFSSLPRPKLTDYHKSMLKELGPSQFKISFPAWSGFSEEELLSF